MHQFFSCVWLILLSMPSRFIYQMVRLPSFCEEAKYLSTMFMQLYVYTNLFIHVSINKHVSCFHIFTIVPMRTQLSNRMISFPYATCKLYGSQESSALKFLRSLHTVLYNDLSNLYYLYCLTNTYNITHTHIHAHMNEHTLHTF